MTRTRRSPGTESRATSTPPSADRNPTAAELDIALAGGANADIWAALFAGQFRLAVKCDRCGRWLTAGPSKRAGIGSHCAARMVTE